MSDPLDPANDLTTNQCSSTDVGWDKPVGGPNIKILNSKFTKLFFQHTNLLYGFQENFWDQMMHSKTITNALWPRSNDLYLPTLKYEILKLIYENQRVEQLETVNFVHKINYTNILWLLFSRFIVGSRWGLKIRSSCGASPNRLFLTGNSK